MEKFYMLVCPQRLSIYISERKGVQRRYIYHSLNFFFNPRLCRYAPKTPHTSVFSVSWLIYRKYMYYSLNLGYVGMSSMTSHIHTRKGVQRRCTSLNFTNLIGYVGMPPKTPHISVFSVSWLTYRKYNHALQSQLSLTLGYVAKDMFFLLGGLYLERGCTTV